MNVLEKSYALAQKQVSVALATAEQLKTSDLPAQVLSLHSEMKARLAEMQQATVSLEQLSQLQKTLKGKSEEFEGVRIQVEGLTTLSAQLSRKVDDLTQDLGEAESRLEDRHGQISTISTTLDEQVEQVLRQKQQLDTYQTQLEASALEMAAVRLVCCGENVSPLLTHKFMLTLSNPRWLPLSVSALREASAGRPDVHAYTFLCIVLSTLFMTFVCEICILRSIVMQM